MVVTVEKSSCQCSLFCNCTKMVNSKDFVSFQKLIIIRNYFRVMLFFLKQFLIQKKFNGRVKWLNCTLTSRITVHARHPYFSEFSTMHGLIWVMHEQRPLCLSESFSEFFFKFSIFLEYFRKHACCFGCGIT